MSFKQRSQLLSSIRYDDISICQADLSFAPLKLIIHALIVDNRNRTLSMLLGSSITIVKHALIYQHYHSQVLAIMAVKITIMNTF